MKDAAPMDRTGEDNLRTMYEFAPFPDLGADLKDLSLYLNPIHKELEARSSLKFLEVGCGTGHYIVGVAKNNPDWDCYGTDLSQPSLGIARQLAEKHGAKVKFQAGSYLDSLPYDFKFDVICAMGTIHHTVDPVAAMKNLRRYIADDGYLLLHLYGTRGDQKKFDIKDALSILEPDLSNYEKRFFYYQTLMKHNDSNWLKRIALTTPGQVYANLLSWWKDFKRRRRGVSWSPAWNARHIEITPSWIDHFCNPCERAYEVTEVKELVTASGFRVAYMLKQGREHMKLIPPEWQTAYDKLDDWEKWRLSELLAVGGTSFAIIARPD